MDDDDLAGAAPVHGVLFEAGDDVDVAADDAAGGLVLVQRDGDLNLLVGVPAQLLAFDAGVVVDAQSADVPLEMARPAPIAALPPSWIVAICRVSLPRARLCEAFVRKLSPAAKCCTAPTVLSQRVGRVVASAPAEQDRTRPCLGVSA